MKKMVKRVAAGFMTAVVASTAIMFAACTQEDASKDNAVKLPVDNAQVETPIVPETPSLPENVVRPNGSYNFSSNIAFLGADLMTTSETGAATYEPVSVELTATVYPADANQNVSWAVEFVNPTSAWATGKVASDYVSVEAKTAGSTTAKTTCIRPFAEQIKVICRSVENEDIFSECVVDFIQAIKSRSVKFGDLEMNMGGQTDVVFEINPNGKGIGGKREVDVTFFEDYTIPVTWASWAYVRDPRREEYVSEEKWGTYGTASAASDGCFVLNGQDFFIMPPTDSGSSLSDAQSYFVDYLRFDFSNVGGWIKIRDNLGRYTFLESKTLDEIIEYFENIENGVLFKLWETYGLYFEYNGESNSVFYFDWTLINVTGYTNVAKVKSITFENSGFYF